MVHVAQKMIAPNQEQEEKEEEPQEVMMEIAVPQELKRLPPGMILTVQRIPAGLPLVPAVWRRRLVKATAVQNLTL